MARRKDGLPTYRKHSSGLAFVECRGRRKYLGLHGSDESLAQYRVICDKIRAERRADGIASKPTAVDVATVAGLVQAFHRHAKAFYRGPDGAETTWLKFLKRTLGELTGKFGALNVSAFGAKELKAFRAAWIAKNAERRTTNSRVGAVVQMFAWGVEEGIVDAGTWQTLKAVRPLQAGRSDAKESAPVTTVPDEVVERTIAELRPEHVARVRFQLLTGCRPGEACSLTADQVDQSDEIWIYRPRRHKMRYRGKKRAIAIGARGQEQARILFGFRPVNVDTYRQAIIRAAARAGVPQWFPNQLRHNRGTEIRRAYGLEAAQTALGHERADVTQIYAERDLELAKRVAREIG